MKTSTQIITTNTDNNADGVIDSRTSSTNTYDLMGNLITRVFEANNNADGTIDFRSSDTNTYDLMGNQLTGISEIDTDGDSLLNYRISNTNTYDQMGNQLTNVYESDENADGTIDYRQETLYEYSDGNKYVMGVSTGEVEVFADDLIDFPVNPLSEQFNLPFTVSEI
jgi:hypothetical protein